jgi:hypothetical protein
VTAGGLCPECGEEVEDVAPENYIGAAVAEYRHLSDGAALCPVNSRYGYVPGEPIEHQVVGA